MLRKLRIKFIINNMTIFTVMLGFIFGLIYYSTGINLERQSLQMMGTIARNPMSIAPPDGRLEDVHLPYFTVIIDSTGEKIELGGGFFDLSDEDLLQQILDDTISAQSRSGVLKEYNLRYLRSDTPIGQCIVFSDITSEQTIMRDLIKNFIITGITAFLVFFGISVLFARWAIKPVEKAWVQQKQFVADASHELKTPLTVIMTDAELLHAPQCTENERVQLSGSIIAMSQQMRGLVESMLELARVESGSVRTELSKVEFSQVVSEAAMMFEPVFFEKGLSFSYDLESDIIVCGDRTKLKQLADILMDNAAKYASPGGEVRLTLSKLSTKKCRLKVSNQGETIKPEDMKNLFTRFYRADRARTQNHSYGLGLSIAETIVREHKGQIKAESNNGYNSFYADFPVA